MADSDWVEPTASGSGTSWSYTPPSKRAAPVSDGAEAAPAAKVRPSRPKDCVAHGFRVLLTYCIESGMAASMLLLAGLVARSSLRGQIILALTRQPDSVRSNETGWVRDVLVVSAARPLASSFSFFQVGWPLACLSHNVLGVRARPAPSVDTSAEAAAASWGALFCSVFCT